MNKTLFAVLSIFLCSVISTQAQSLIDLMGSVLNTRHDEILSLTFIPPLVESGSYFLSAINPMTHITEEEGRLLAINFPKLRELNLSFNRLTSLPESIGGLVCLQRLCLNHNCLTSLPASLGRLNDLHELHALGNPLRHLPESLISHGNLAVLNIEFEKLEVLSASSSRLKNATKMNLLYGLAPDPTQPWWAPRLCLHPLRPQRAADKRR